jgi:hypothetical protein
MEFESGSPLWIMTIAAGSALLAGVVRFVWRTWRGPPSPPDPNWEPYAVKVRREHLERKAAKKAAKEQGLLPDLRSEHLLFDSEGGSTSPQRDADRPA